MQNSMSSLKKTAGRRFRSAMAALLAMAAGIAPAVAQPAAVEIIGPARPPYIVDKDGMGAGPAVEIVQRLALDVGLSPQVRIMPFQRAVKHLDEGGTIYPALLRTPQREQKYVWIGEVFTDRAVIYTRSREPMANDIVSARRLRRISVMQGSELQGMLRSFGLANFETNNSEIDNARLLQAGRIDGWFTLRAVGRATWRELDFDPAQLRAGEPFALMSFWIAASEDLPATMINSLRRSYDALRRSGEYDRIIAPLLQPPS